MYATPANSDTWNKLLAAIPYSTDEIIPIKSDILSQWLVHEDHEETLLKQLHNCKTGKENAKAYEDVCNSILVATFRDQLTLWKTQAPSNSNLYKFDLLCRIKDGHGSTFWRIVKNNFFSKYVVFEYPPGYQSGS